MRPSPKLERGFTLHCKRLACLSAAVVVASMATGVTASAMAASLSGAGSTLVAPLELKWASGWNSGTGNTVNYAAVGSGTGITQVTNGLVDFGASDAPLSATQQAACPQCVQIPWGLSATAVGFHLSGISKLKLTGPVLAQIYLGKITNWDNTAIKKLNKGVKLPNRKITVIYRSDGSGDTYAFTNYLSHVSGAWSHNVGTATTVSFPTGIQGKGNSGVTAILTNTNGGIAYIAASYLVQQGGLGAVAIKNAAGKYEYPNLSSIQSAGNSVSSVPSNNAISIADPPKSAKIAYPISTFTYVIVPRNTGKGALLKSFIAYALTTGQQFGALLDFATIPTVVLNAAQSTLATLP
jgi:phosphate transport system substrate-binding protein